jgi:hypothetical protein
MLIARMDDHPHEFVNPSWDPVSRGAWESEPFENVRWGNLIRAMYVSGSQHLFTQEEIDTFQTKYKELLRKYISASVIKELVGNEFGRETDFHQRQLDLPYVSQSTAVRFSDRKMFTAKQLEEAKQRAIREMIIK